MKTIPPLRWLCLTTLLLLAVVATATAQNSSTNLPVVAIQATDASAAEPTAGAINTGTFKIRREGATNAPLTVHFLIAGTASNGVDYVTLPNHVTIPTGEYFVNLLVQPLADNLPEPAETVILKLVLPITADAPTYRIGVQSNATVTIAANEQPPVTNYPPIVNLVSPTNGNIFPPPANINICASVRDEDGFVTKVEFFAGDHSLGIVTNNSATPVNTTIKLCLPWPNVPVGEYTLTAKATDDDGATKTSASVKIYVREPEYPRPVVTIHATDATAVEPGSTNANPGAFTVTRTFGTNELTVYYRISGTASNGLDYAPLPGTVVIPAHALSVNIPVTPLADNLAEEPERVVLNLLPPVCIAINPPSPDCYVPGTPSEAAVTIYDNLPTPPPPTNKPPTAFLISPKNGAVFVIPTNLTLVAEAGDTDGSVTNVAFYAGDQFLGSDSGPKNHYSVIWSNVAPGLYNLKARATDDDGATGPASTPVTITVLATNRPPESNRPPVVTIQARDALAAEGTNHWVAPSNNVPTDHYPDGINTATFVVRRDGPTNTTLAVKYAVSGTASNGVDYQTISGTVNLPAGERSALIVIKPIDDDLPECPETVVLNLKPNPNGTTNAPSYTIGWPERAAAVIINNDTPPPGTRLLCDGTFQIGDHATNGTNYRIEVSANMLNWIPVCTNEVVDGGIYFTDPEPPDSSTRFYRAIPMESAPE